MLQRCPSSDAIPGGLVEHGSEQGLSIGTEPIPSVGRHFEIRLDGVSDDLVMGLSIERELPAEDKEQDHTN